MKKLVKLIIFFLFPVSFVLMFIFAINIFISDFRYAHQSHMIYQPPFSWSKYYVTLFSKKFLINTFYTKKVGLPQIHLYIGEQSQEKLLSKTPNSTKQWVEGSLLNANGNLQKIQIRYRGDNPQNWLYEKKHLRIKTRKNEMHERRRYYEYTGFDLEVFPLNNIANRMGILTNNSKLVELFINGQSNGIFMQDERFDENFLRRNEIMPINLYKGENHNTESRIGIDKNLYNNPGLWVKTAIFNQKDVDDKSDLEKFLSTLQSAEVRNEDFNELFNYIDIDTWANYASFLILAQSYQADHFHNVRIAIDPWNGFVYPILQDPHPVAIDPKVYTSEYSTDDLLSLLNRSSLFIDRKYKKLFDYTVNSKVLSDEIIYLNKIYKDFQISGKRDPEINLKKTLKNIDIYKNDLKEMEKSIKDKLFARPISSWYKNSKNINIFVEGELPVSDIQLAFDSQVPEWIGIDTNYNGIIDNNEYKFFSNGKKRIFIPAKFYSNRVALSKRKIAMLAYPNFSIKTSTTKFNIISEKNIMPKNISANNSFSGKKFTLSYVNTVGVQANKFNKVIFNEDLEKKENKMKDFSGKIYVTENFVINDPVTIYPGTQFFINEGSHIIFKNKVIAKGTSTNPIIFKKNKDSLKSWGTIALIGQLTAGSEFSHITIDGGSGGNYNQINFTSMFSLHDTKNVKMKKIKLINHSDYDDMMHIIYCDNITIDKAELIDAAGDAIDVDISTNVTITNSKFINSTNDAIDFMESEALVDSSFIAGSNDKGISVGESSNILIYNTIFEKNNIALAVKDKSSAKILHVNFKDNKTQLSAYKKNWQYGGGGNAYIYRSYFTAKENLLKISKESSLLIDDTSVIGKKLIQGENITIKNVDFYDSFANKDRIKNKEIIESDIKLLHPMYFKISSIKNKNRGYNNLEK
tara:strand:+ start:2091 stop:4844 length:2754 start_codon:yes stop_codon:yes gene_type:complete